MGEPELAQAGKHNSKQNSGTACLQKTHLKLNTEKFKVKGYRKIHQGNINQKKLVISLCKYLGKLYFTRESVTRYERLTFGTDKYRIQV